MDIKIIKEKMDTSIKYFDKELLTLRTSRANPSMLDNIFVEAYGAKTSINQLGNINVPEANMISIQVWDTTLINTIEKAINESNLGINPQTEGQLIRLPIPQLSEERRQELAKIASQYGEKAKIAIRNNRRDFMDKVKKDEKDKIISQDESKKNLNEIQKLTDEYISKIDKHTLSKQEEILKV
jgi:ribosome recycling factor